MRIGARGGFEGTGDRLESQRRIVLVLDADLSTPAETRYLINILDPL